MRWEEPAAMVAAAVLLAAAACLGASTAGYHGPGRRIALRALRLGAALCAALTAAGLSVPAATMPLRLAVLWDATASMGESRAAAAAAFVEGLRGKLPHGASLSVARFPATEGREGVRPEAGSSRERTDIEAALLSSVAQLEAGADNRVVLLSDGRENAGAALRAVAPLRAIGAKVFAAELAGASDAAVRVRRVTAPGRVVPGEQFDVVVTVAYEGAGTVVAELAREGSPAEVRESAFEGTGERELTFHQTAERTGRAAYRLTVRGPGEGAAAGRAREFEVDVEEPPAVTLLAGEPAEAADLAGLLRRAGLPLEVTEPEDWLLGAGEPPARSVLVLDNVPPQRLGVVGMERIERLVRERGVGLLVIGGQAALAAQEAAGTALERALPVLTGAASGAPERDLALVIVIDSSLSMFFHGRVGGGFHRSTVPRKIEAAKAATLEMARALRPGDSLGILESKDRLFWVHPLGPPADLAELERRVAAIKAIGGGIYFYSSVREAAEALRGSGRPLRMVMVVCDTNDIDQMSVENLGESADLVRQMAAEGISLSIFSIGYPTDKDVPFLKSMAALGRGDFYLVSNLASLPRYLRTEYAKKTGESVREEEVLPLVRDFDPLLKGIDAGGLPSVRAMHLLTPRRGAQQLLVAPSGAPLLARWHYGRGASAVFASDNGVRWAPAWTTWPDAERFWRQLLFSLAPRPRAAPVEARAEAGPGGRRLRFVVRTTGAGPPERGFRSASLQREGERVAIDLERTGLDVYRASSPRELGTGTWRFAIGGEGGAPPVAGGRLDVPPPPETEGVDGARGRDLLESLARETGGALVAAPEEVLTMPTEPAPRRPDLAFWLLPLGMLALFAEVILRR